jgi:hypothetical protein
MKKLLLSVILAAGLMACNQPEKKKDIQFTTDGSDIRFDKETYDFGKIKQGEVVSYRFAFTNTGKAPLIISNATATCGCTVPAWPKTPVLPGDTASIAVTFNSTGKVWFAGQTNKNNIKRPACREHGTFNWRSNYT